MAAYKVKPDAPQVKKAKPITDKTLGQGKGFWKSTASAIWHAPKKAYSASGAIKNTAKCGLSSVRQFIVHKGKTRSQYLNSKIQKKFSSFESGKKSGLLNPIDKDGVPALDKDGVPIGKLSNPYSLAKNIIDANKSIEEKKKKL